MMDEDSFFVESMLEADAGHCYDFNATHVSINESIFGKFLLKLN